MGKAATAAPLAIAKQELLWRATLRVCRGATVTHIAASSTRIDRVAVRLVPAYTLALEPDQAIELSAKPKKPFDVLLRVHSYATKPGKVDVGLTAPHDWTVSPPVQPAIRQLWRSVCQVYRHATCQLDPRHL